MYALFVCVCVCVCIYATELIAHCEISTPARTAVCVMCVCSVCACVCSRVRVCVNCATELIA